MCPYCPVKPRPIGGLNLPGLFGTTPHHHNLFGGAASSAFPGFAQLGETSSASGSGGGSVEELRRKAHEHSAVLLASLQQHAMEFHLQQQRKTAKEAAEAAETANNNPASD